MTLNTRVLEVALATAILAGIATPALIAAEGQSSNQEKDLIAVLQSDAAPPDKASTCKKLAVYGGKEAVPALAALLVDRELSSWARIALEAIPDPSASEALRSAVGKTQGRLLIGVINSLGVRRDAPTSGAGPSRGRSTPQSRQRPSRHAPEFGIRP